MGKSRSANWHYKGDDRGRGRWIKKRESKDGGVRQGRGQREDKLEEVQARWVS